MEYKLHFIELCHNFIRFDAVSQLTDVFFDDSNKQIFAVRSGGATGVVVKGPSEDSIISFCMNDRGAIRYIKFSQDNKILAVQRSDNTVEFICFLNDQPLLNNILISEIKSHVFGFVWINFQTCAIFSNNGVEILSVMLDKLHVRSIKSLNMSIKWFSWSAEAKVALLCSTESNTLWPILIKQKSITKLPKLELRSSSHEIQESKVTVSQIYGTAAVLILQPDSTGAMEVEIYLLNGPGLAPRKCHVLKLGLVGRFAINTVDNLVVVHHQASATSLLFDVALKGESINDCIYHNPVVPGRSIRPFSIKLPSLSPDGQTFQCELYSTNWVLFQPNVVIDAKLGCMWYLNLCLEPICNILSDHLQLTDFLLQRTDGKCVLLNVMQRLANEHYTARSLCVLENIFNKVNKEYSIWVRLTLQTQTAQPSHAKTFPKQLIPIKVLIEQTDMLSEVFQGIAEYFRVKKLLLFYLQSLCTFEIALQEDLSKMVIWYLIRERQFYILRGIVNFSLLSESKSIVCCLLSYYNIDNAIYQLTIDISIKIKVYEIIIEVLLEQGNIIDALRIAKNSLQPQKISGRKFLEAAQKTNNSLIIFSVNKYFQSRSLSGTMLAM